MSALLNKRRVAEELGGISLRSVDRIPASELPRVRVGVGRILFRPEDVAAYVAQRVTASRTVTTSGKSAD